MAEQFANFAQGILAAPITAGQTSISITPIDYTGRSAPSNFPSQGNFRIVVQSFDVTTQIPTSAPEIMKVTAVAGNTFTVQRGAESSIASAFASGAQVVHVLTAGVQAAFLQNITGLLVASSNITITGSGTTASPYAIAGSASGSGITSINSSTASAQIFSAGTNMTISTNTSSGVTTFTASSGSSSIPQSIFNTFG